ncbi:hypothetical protein TcCL_Unassigned04386 [Trypanosoma cruzi]|nr:hypothetical protein TcCL_Unassigned04386 [Trypanosoma cruzi]
MVCAVPFHECRTPPVGEGTSKGLRYVLGFAYSLLSRLCVCCAHCFLLRCDVGGVASACVFLHALSGGLLFPMTAPLCVCEWGEKRCVRERAWVAADPPANPGHPQTCFFLTAFCGFQAVERERI